MRKLAILIFQTLDGVMQAPGSPEEDASGGFTSGGWARDYWNETMEQVLKEAMAQPYDLVLGRKTYELFAPAWSKAPDENPVAVKLNTATKYVFTSTLTRLDWENSIPISGNLPAEIAKLKAQDGPLLQVHGSWQLVQGLLAHELIDEFRIWTFPVIVGNGKRLFDQQIPPTILKPIKSEPCQNGVMMNIYRPKSV